jgi:outer membrane protein assembly factor BamB
MSFMNQPRSLTLLLLLVALTVVPGLLQAQTKPAWEVTPGGTITWMRTTSTGDLVVCTSEGLKGIEPLAGKVRWTVKELANAPESGYSEIVGTPYISVAPAGSTGGSFILEPYGGAVLFSSTTSGITDVTSTHFLYPNNAIVLVGRNAEKKPVMACVDMATARVRWTKDETFSTITGCTSAGKDAVLLSTLFFTYKLDANTGAELWKQTPDPIFHRLLAISQGDKNAANPNIQVGEIHSQFITTPHAPEHCFMIIQQSKITDKQDADGKTTSTLTHHLYLNAFRISDGTAAWEKSRQLRQSLGVVVPMKEGLLVGSAENNRIDLIAYTTGISTWNNSLSGPLQNAVAMPEGLLVIAGTTSSVLTLLDPTGRPKWNTRTKLDGPVRSITRVPDGGVLISSTTQTDLLDLATGASKLSAPIKAPHDMVTVHEKNILVFNPRNRSLLTIPFSGQFDRTQGGQPLEFEGKETPEHMEAASYGVAMTSAQNVALLKPDGSIQYRKYFPAVRESSLKRALQYAHTTRTAYADAARGTSGTNLGAAASGVLVADVTTASAREPGRQIASLYGEAASLSMEHAKQFLARAQARMKASTTASGVHFILTDGGKGELNLMRVNKKDGSVAEAIALGSTRQYEVDPFEGVVYMVQDAKVVAYR